jgi:hypothetical protein
MKRKFTHVMTGICIGSALMVHPFNSMAAGTEIKDPKEKNKPATTSAKTTARKAAKVSSSRNNGSVKIYPDIVKRVMHVVAKDDNIDFFVFDLEGTLMKHYKMNAGDHEKLSDLERGRYIFRIFDGDEETASGNFDIR